MSCTELRGLYAITDPLLCTDLLNDAREAVAGGVRILQYRNKLATHEQQRKEAAELRQLCDDHDVIFIINDNPQLALEVEAHGVHVGQADDSISKARSLLGADKIIGVSCNNIFDYAVQAQQQGADYVAFGRFYASNTKPNAPQADIGLLQRARKELTVPVVAIGGIQHDNAAELISAGANMIAVIEAIFGQPDRLQAARELASLFE